MEWWGYNKNVQKAVNKVGSEWQVLNMNSIIVEIPPPSSSPTPIYSRESQETESETISSDFAGYFVSDLIIFIFLCAKEINTVSSN